MAEIAVAALEPAWTEPAAALAQRLQLPLMDVPVLDQPEPSLLLLLGADGLLLQQTGRKRPGPVSVDFVSGSVAHRRLYGGGKGQLIAKACGIKGSLRPTIADVTAGLGRDAFVLATLGCQVQLVERAPVVHALLADGMARAADSDVADILARMSLVQADARTWLNRLSAESAPDVVYLDPMFPHSDKSAQVKKEMLAFRHLVGADEDTEELLAAALSAARCRVVVKRPRKAPPIAGPDLPSYALEGKSGRFDIYALRKLGD